MLEWLGELNLNTTFTIVSWKELTRTTHEITESLFSQFILDLWGSLGCRKELSFIVYGRSSRKPQLVGWDLRYYYYFVYIVNVSDLSCEHTHSLSLASLKAFGSSVPLFTTVSFMEVLKSM